MKERELIKRLNSGVSQREWTKDMEDIKMTRAKKSAITRALSLQVTTHLKGRHAITTAFCEARATSSMN